MQKKLIANCPFCRIIAGTEKSYIIFENDKFISFLDKKPLFLGHSLLLPKAHVQTLYDLPERLIKPFFLYLQRIGSAIEHAMDADGSFVAINNIISQSVPHLHTHIVPRHKNDGLKGFFWPRQHYVNEQQMTEIQEKIKRYLLNH